MISPATIRWLHEACDLDVDASTAVPVAGGCIHEATLVKTSEGRLVFLKQNTPDQLPLFKAEAASLGLLHQAKSIRVPVPYAAAIIANKAVFALEGLSLKRERSDGESARRLGLGLAKLHENLSPDGSFGAPFPNFLGATPQSNTPCEAWADFYLTERLEPQFRFAERRGKRFRDESVLKNALHAHLAALKIAPALIHGDLWGGNVSILETGEPVIFDPATHYADRECDLAMTSLFGGFSPAFYEAYRSVHPAPEPVREKIYQLYHVLNHFHLFGGAYAGDAESLIRDILDAL